MKTMKQLASSCIVLVLCMAMLLTGTITYAAETTNAGEMARDGVVYSTKEELFSAMRKAMVAREKVTNLYFEMTEGLTAEISAIDLMELRYHMFDFYGDQTGIPAKEGDYLLNTYTGTSLWVNGNSVGMDIYGSYTTPDQEAAFDSKFASLFAGGGALAGTKSMSKADAVVKCMEYINANVKGISSWKDVDHSAYGALCQGAATCQGKSLLLYRMLRELGIANRILMGQDAGAHTYNIVLIDGKYYYCDPSTTTVILKGSNSFHPAALQEQWQKAAFQNNIMSRISASDYPLKTETQTPSADTGNSNAGNSNAGNSNTGNSNTGSSNTGNSNTGANNNGNSNTNTNTNNNTNNTQNNTAQNPSNDSQQQTNAEPVEYEILDGADSTYATYQPGEEGLSLRAAGEIEKFVSVEVDGEIVDPKYYTVEEGSTIVKFTKEFMDMLAEGNHVVKFNFTDGFANANITVAVLDEVVDEAVTEMPEEETEDSTELPSEAEGKDKGSNAWIWVVVVIIIVAAGAAGVVFYIKKRQENTEPENTEVEDTSEEE